MKKLLLAICVLGMCGVALADGPQVSFGPAGDSPTLPQRDACQYGFTDYMPGSGYTLGLGQQLGITCAGPMTITSVGAFFEFIVTAGTMNIFNNYLPRGDFQGYLDAALSATMILLVIVIAVTSASCWWTMLTGEKGSKAIEPGYAKGSS